MSNLIGYGVRSLKIQSVRYPKNDEVFKSSKNRNKFLDELGVKPLKGVDSKTYPNYYAYRILDPKSLNQYMKAYKDTLQSSSQK